MKTHEQNVSKIFRKKAFFIPLIIAFLGTITGCHSRQGLYHSPYDREEFERISEHAQTNVFQSRELLQSDNYASKEDITSFSSEADGIYRFGAGDEFAFVVRGRQDISVPNVIVSPDGKVALPRVGILEISGKSLEEVTQTITERLKHYYEEPEVTLVMKTYNNNKVYVLGRVANPGVVHFTGRGSLLEALSLAGGLPSDTAGSWLSRCMIVRGDNIIIWVDLKDLLDNGNMALNARLRNGDVIYIPQSVDQVAYVMGAVNTPGVIQLRSKMTLLDAIMYRGGPTVDATNSKIYLVRATDRMNGAVEEIDLRDMYSKGDLRKNYILKDGDIVFVPTKGIKKYNYYVEQIIPTLTAINLTLDAAESLGALQAFREEVWGQTGFIYGGGN